MDIQYEKNFIKPTDPNYVYDKKVDFSNDNLETNEWDD